MDKKGHRYFVLQEKGADTNHVFRGRTPRQAALKAARKGYDRISLRERGATKKGLKRIHVFNGSRVQAPVPQTAPEWLRKNEKMWVSNVQKIKIDHRA